MSDEEKVVEPVEEEKVVEPVEPESQELINYKIITFRHAVNELYDCKSHYTTSYDISTCKPTITYDPACEIPKPSDMSLNDLYLAKFKELPYDVIRENRNSLLAGSDWVGLSDVKLDNIEEWKTYRQTLRDLPNDYQDATFDMAGNVIGVEYPVKPL